MKSESKVEEIIAALWFILGALLWHRAPDWIVYTIWINATFDLLCSVYYAIKGLRDERRKLQEETKEP